jgi:lipopolysaccharide export system protein LptC
MIRIARPSALVGRKTRPRRRKSVSALRLALPAVAGLVGLAIVAQATVRASQARSSHVAPADAALRMENPRFTGAMKDGGEFLILATAATRDKTDPNLVSLDGPRLTRGYGSDTPTQVISRQGVYDEAKGSLLLTGDVRINNGEGYAFATEKALIDTRTGQVIGDAGVQGSGVSGNKVQADSYAVTDKGDRVVFKGRVRTRLNPNP